MKIVMVIPVYLCDQALYPIIEQCFESLRVHYPQLQTYVMDDASPLPVPDHWKSADGMIIKQNENLGYTKNVNSGLSMAFGWGADIVIVANDDLIFQPGDLDRFKNMTGLQIASPRDTASSPDNKFGAIWGITKEVYELLGPLDERFKNYFSDLEYYRRALDNNVEVVKWPDILIDHRESATYNLLDKEMLLAEDGEKYREAYDR